jgi:hypothetical protein
LIFETDERDVSRFLWIRAGKQSFTFFPLKMSEQTQFTNILAASRGAISQGNDLVGAVRRVIS